jgi:hypothetical protein
MTDLFGVEGTVLLDTVQLPVPYKARVASLRGLIESLDFEIDLFTKLARGRLAKDPGYTAIQQIPGIGPVLAAVFVAEIGDVHRFAQSSQLASWAGLTPRHRESDTTVHRGRWATIESVKILPDTSYTSAPSAKRSRTVAATATSGPWPRPENSCSWSSMGCATTRCVPCSTVPARHDKPVSGRRGSCRS